MVKSSEIVKKLNLRSHQEGGFFYETFRDSSVILSTSHLPPTFKVDRAVSTSIYFLLPSGNVSRLHRIPMAETWHFYLGEPLTVVEIHDDGKLKFTCLGPDLIEGDQKPQYTVPPNIWFGSFPTKDFHFPHDGNLLRTEPRDSENHFSLVGCTCAPGFQFEDFELAKRSHLLSLFPQHESLITMLSYPE
ncbi:hypothetical protein Rs2_36552 [Raphanus sativus]|uniref:Uncharacterized protein LOC108822880 n=1 Tax=Raphanus sativus TaxID=3726 RepID=A0A6J0KTF1_RAPSA|nr:uncharacterized protein LOC108822880 [Raphanus sativus]KAJ4879498.1 hypothetical protein Rs2_36552 [Raphanus sativus]